MLVFFLGCDFCLLFFSGLNLAPDELRTNSERTLALSFFLELIFLSVLNFLGFGRTKTLELQLVDAFFVQIQCYQGKQIIETCLIQVFHAKKQLFHTTKNGQAITQIGQTLEFNTGVELKLIFLE